MANRDARADPALYSSATVAMLRDWVVTPAQMDIVVRTYRACTESATLASTRFSTEGATIAAALAQTSVFASESPKKAEAAPEATPDTAASEQQAQAKPASQRPAEPEPPD